MAKRVTQEDAELMAQIYRDMNEWRTGSVSKDMKKLVEKMDEMRMKKHPRIFNEKTQWRLIRKGKNFGNVKVTYGGY